MIQAKTDTNSLELLVPAGDKNAFGAAVLAEANAIFFGVENFNARNRAENIKSTQLEQLLPLATSRGIHPYLTLNILLKDSELEEALNVVKNAVNAGVEAIIIQDLGVAFLIKKLFPQVAIHASTQLTTHNTSQVDFLETFGFNQINLSRELSLRELQKIVPALHKKNIVPEIFIHGAYCISYSGQCYFSNFLYGESGNRGKCVQPCRRFYTCSEQKETFFNLRDNNAHNFVNDLINLAPVSLKIEGRIKSFDYVYTTTKVWKSLLQGSNSAISADELGSVYNRGFSDGYLRESISQEMFTFGMKDHSLEKIGFVKSYTANNSELLLNTTIPLAKKDELFIYDEKDTFICSGVIVEVKSPGKIVFSIQNKLYGKIKNGQKVLRSKNKLNKEELYNKIQALKPVKKPLAIFVKGKLEEPLEIGTSLNGMVYSVVSQTILTKASNFSLTQEIIAEKLGKLGETSFYLAECNCQSLDKDLFLPIKELNEMRRNLIAQIEVKSALSDFSLPKLSDFSRKAQDFSCYFFTDEIDKAQKIISLGGKVLFELSLFDDFENFKQSAAGEFLLNHKEIALSIPAILFPKHETFIKTLLEKLNDGRILYCENSGIAFYAQKMNFRIILGSQLNIANSYALAAYFEKINAVGFVPSLELASEDLSKLQIPENVELWYPLVWNLNLLQSRQCLVCRMADCKKSKMDDACIYNCEKSFSFEGMQGEKLKAVKRKGHYSGIYPDKLIGNFTISKDFSPHQWILDVRSFSLNTIPIDELVSCAIFNKSISRIKEILAINNSGFLNNTSNLS